MWHLKIKYVPVVGGALGLIKKETQEEITKIRDEPSLLEISKNSSNKHNTYPVKVHCLFTYYFLIADFCLIM